MSKLSLTANLTGTLEAHALTHRGMAYFASTGPAGEYCRDCVFFAGPARLGAKDDYRCHKHKHLTGKSGEPFSGFTPCCKFFEKRPETWKRLSSPAQNKMRAQPLFSELPKQRRAD